MVGQIRRNTEIRELIRSIEQIAPNHITLYNERTIEKEFLESQDLMLIAVKAGEALLIQRAFGYPIFRLL